LATVWLRLVLEEEEVDVEEEGEIQESFLNDLVVLFSS